VIVEPRKCEFHRILEKNSHLTLLKEFELLDRRGFELIEMRRKDSCPQAKPYS